MNSTDHSSFSNQQYNLTNISNESISNKSDLENENITINFLPDETWLQIFSHVQIQDMDSLQLTCKRFRAIAHEAGYRELFKREFGQTRFNRTTTSLDWRIELIARTEALRKWRRGTGGARSRPNISCTPGVDVINHTEADFDSNRTVVFSKYQGLGMVVDHTKGKIGKPRLGTDQSLQPHPSTTCVSSSRFGMIFGSITGKVSAVIFSHDMRSRRYVKLDKAHSRPVSDVWISKISAPSKQNLAFSAGKDGIVFTWNLDTGKVVDEFTFNGPLIKVSGTDKKDIIVLDAEGTIFFINSKDKSIRKLGIFPSFDSAEEVFFEVCGEYVFIAQNINLLRFDINGEMHSFAVKSLNSNTRIVAMAIDRTVFPTWITSTGAPGDNWSYIAVADSSSNIHIFAGFTRGAGAATKRDAELNTEPLLVIENESRVDSLSMNSVVLLVSTRFGSTSARNLLTGRYLGTVCGEVYPSPRRAVITVGPSQTIVDSQPENAQGLTVVGGNLQYFNFGIRVNSQIKRKGIQVDPRRTSHPRRRHSSGSHERSSGIAIRAAIQQEMEIMEDDEERQKHMQEFFQGELSEDEQLEYALMLSRDQPELEPELARAMAASMETSMESNGASSENDEEEQMMRAVEISMREQISMTEQTLDNEQDEIDLALQLSLHER